MQGIVGIIVSILGLALVLLQWGLPEAGIALSKSCGLVMVSLGGLLLVLGIGSLSFLLVQWVRKQRTPAETEKEPSLSIEVRQPPTLFRANDQFLLEANITLSSPHPPLMIDKMQLKMEQVTVSHPANLTLPIKLETKAQSFTVRYELPFYASAFGRVKLGEEKSQIWILAGGKEYSKEFVMPERVESLPEGESNGRTL